VKLNLADRPLAPHTFDIDAKNHSLPASSLILTDEP